MRACVVVWRCTRGVGSSTAPRRWACSVPHSGGARVRRSSAVCGAPELPERPAQQDDDTHCARGTAGKPHRRTEVSRCEYSEYPCAHGAGQASLIGGRKFPGVSTPSTHVRSTPTVRNARRPTSIIGVQPRRLRCAATARHKRAHSHTKAASARWVQMWAGWAQSRRRCGSGEAQSRRRCGSGEAQSRCRCGRR
jgi:hypothetical protein